MIDGLQIQSINANSAMGDRYVPRARDIGTVFKPALLVKDIRRKGNEWI